MAASPTPVQVPRLHLGASYDRLLRQFHKRSSAPVQHQVFQPGLRWRGCSRTVRLGIPKQFRQRPVSFDNPHTTAHSGTTGGRNSLSTVVASTTLVSNTTKIVHRPPLRLPNWKHLFLRSTHTPELLHNHSLKLFDTRISERKN